MERMGYLLYFHDVGNGRAFVFLHSYPQYKIGIDFETRRVESYKQL